MSRQSSPDLSRFSYQDGKLLRDGAECGFLDNCGYLRVCIGGRKYLNHRIIYKLHNPHFDLFSDEVIDHIDRNRTNNLIDNLRAVSKAENNKNRGKHKGVSYCKQTGKWKAIWPKWLGRYNTEEEAINAVKQYTED